jgi:hypothetical protein
VDAIQKQTLRALKNTLRYINRGWTRMATARDKNSKPVHWNSKKACYWCLTGAMQKAARYRYDVLNNIAVQVIHANRFSRHTLTDFNDNAQSKHVVKVALEHAIAELKAGRDFLN